MKAWIIFQQTFSLVNGRLLVFWGLKRVSFASNRDPVPRRETADNGGRGTLEDSPSHVSLDVKESPYGRDSNTFVSRTATTSKKVGTSENDWAHQ